VSNHIPRIFAFFVTILLAMTGLVAAVTQVATAESVISQIGQDIDGEVAGDRVYSVSFSADGSRVAVGSNENDGTLSDPFSIAGHVRIFEYRGNSWVQLGANINGQNADERSGTSVSLSADGTRVAIGAYNNSTNGFSAGAVRVYSYNGTAWVQTGGDIYGESLGDFSGTALSLSDDGTRLAIGADGNDAGGDWAGHVRVFEFVNSDWVQLGADIDGEAAEDFSGWAVKLNSSGTRVAIGARGNDGSASNAGHVRVYDLIGSSWVQVGQDINGEGADDSSGSRDGLAISSDGNRLAIGAKSNDVGEFRAGHVRVYDLVEDAWVQVGSDIDGQQNFENFGKSVAMSADGSRILVGAPLGNGIARVYEFINGEWIQLGADVIGQAVSDNSGDFVGMSGDGLRFGVGSMYHDGGRGHVRVFAISQVSPPASATATSSPKLASTGSDESITGLWIGSTLFVLTIGAATMLFSRLRNRQNK
jgi:WD40 repeat protein